MKTRRLPGQCAAGGDDCGAAVLLLSAVISMGVFVKARQLVDQAALLTAANERMSAWAEELALTPEVEEYLAAQGFSRQADGWTLSVEEAVYTAQATVQPTGAGTRTRVTLEARDAHGTP